MKTLKINTQRNHRENKNRCKMNIIQCKSMESQVTMRPLPQNGHTRESQMKTLKINTQRNHRENKNRCKMNIIQCKSMESQVTMRPLPQNGHTRESQMKTSKINTQCNVYSRIKSAPFLQFQRAKKSDAD